MSIMNSIGGASTGNAEALILLHNEDLAAHNDIRNEISTLENTVNQQNWFSKGTEIPAGADLDSYTTVGKYFCKSGTNTTTLLNKPTNLDSNFVLYVFKRTVSNANSQLIITLDGDIFIRGTTEKGVFYDWKEQATVDYVNTAIESLYGDDTPTAGATLSVREIANDEAISVVSTQELITIEDIDEICK